MLCLSNILAFFFGDAGSTITAAAAQAAGLHFDMVPQLLSPSPYNGTTIASLSPDPLTLMVLLSELDHNS